MGGKSPLNDRAQARKYVKTEMRQFAHSFLQDGAAVFGQVSIDDLADVAIADWDARMADPQRAMPNGEPPNKRKELDHAISHAFHARFTGL